MKVTRYFIIVSILVMSTLLFGLTVSAGNVTYNVSSGNINITNSANTITITGSTTTNTITVAPNVTGVIKIILNDVSIDVSDIGKSPIDSKCAFDIGDGSFVELTLAEGTTNTFKSGATKAGIKVETPESGGTAGSITINGTGTLIATGGSGGPANWVSGSGAGIGSNGIIYNATTVPSAGNITINSGTIKATGGIAASYAGAGIGGGGGSYNGNAPNAGNTTISGGTVIATGGESEKLSGAGIGGGCALYGGTMGTVLIDGGTVTAISGNGKHISSGIGYGFANSVRNVRTDPASITITGNAVVNASSPNGTSVYGAIGHNDKGSITISGTATVTATKGISSLYSDRGTISCNNLTISDSPSITVYSPNKQGDITPITNGGYPKDDIKPIYASSITSSLPIIAGIFPSVPKNNTIVLTKEGSSISKTITLPANYASFATTLESIGTYTGAMGIDVLQNTATLSENFNLTNNVNTFNVKQLDITPPTAPRGLTSAAGRIINAQEQEDGVQVVLSLGTSGALAGDSAELLIDGQPFSTPIKHVLTAAEITANSCSVTIPATKLGADGNKEISARVIDEAGNVGPAGDSLILTLDTVPPTAPIAVTISPIGGTIVSNTLNLTNTNLMATAVINAGEATGGSAKLYINGILKATDNTILEDDTQVTFDLGTSTVSELQLAAQTGGVVTVELINQVGNKSTSLVNNPTLTVDYISPKVDSIDVPASSSYKAGQNLDFTVNFNENVVVTDGTPHIQLILDTGGTVNANYLSGSGTSQLVFRYTVADGNNDNNGIQVLLENISLNGSLIRDGAQNDAELTVRGVGATNEILVDTINPNVLSVNVPASATYISNQNLDFTVNFNENVFVADGTPYIQLILNTGGSLNASYLSGSGSNSLTFRYTTQHGDLDLDGIELGTEINLNGSTIKDKAGNDCVLGLNGVGSIADVKIDAVLPVIDSTVLSSDNTYLDIILSKGIYGTEATGVLTADKLKLTFAKNEGSATNVSISSVKKNDSETQASASALAGGETTIRVFISITGTPSGFESIEIKPANATSVYDAIGNAMLSAQTTGAVLLNDKVAPSAPTAVTVSAIGGTIVSNTLNITNTNMTATALITPQEAVGGSAKLYIDGILKATDNTILDGETQVTFDLGQSTTSGLQTEIQTGGIVTVELYDAAGNKSTSLVNNPSLTVDYIKPEIFTVVVPASSTYKSGEELDFTVNFNENVFVTETPYVQLILNTGSSVNANYISGSGTSSLLFRYTIQQGDLDLDGIELGTEINLNGSTIKDKAGNDCVLGLNGVGSIADVKIDAVLPVIDSAVSSSDNTYIDIIFSKGIYGTETTGVLTADKLKLTFAKNEGSATNVSISSVKKNDSETEGSASALVGGETTIRVFITVTGTASGYETIEIQPVNATSIYDMAGNVMDEHQTTGAIILNDKVVPQVGSSTNFTASNPTHSSIDLEWATATDNKTTESDLQYKVIYSLSNNIDTLEDAEINGMLAQDWSNNLTKMTVTGLSSGQTYYFNIIVKDEAGNKSVYSSLSKSTLYRSSNSNRVTQNIEIKNQDITTKNGITTTTVTVNSSYIEKTLENQGNNAMFTISVPKESDVIVGVLSGQTIKSMENKEAILQIKTNNISYTLPASQINIDNVLEKLEQDDLDDIKVNISISQPPLDTVKIVEDTANKNSYQIVVKPVEFNITCTSGDKSVKVSKFNGYVERTIAIPDGIDPNKITTGVVLNDDGTFTHIPTTIVLIEGKYYARLNSLSNSTYLLIYNSKTFKDVEQHWAKTYINDMASRLVVGGIDTNNFAPDRDITRAEFTAVVIRALGLTETEKSNLFNDVKDSDWFSAVVAKASEYEIINGRGDGNFMPNKAITRQEALVIIAKCMKIMKLDTFISQSELNEQLIGFNDSVDISQWAKESVAICTKAGLIGGSDGNLRPQSNITRAETAAIITRMLKQADLI